MSTLRRFRGFIGSLVESLLRLGRGVSRSRLDLLAMCESPSESFVAVQRLELGTEATVEVEDLRRW